MVTSWLSFFLWLNHLSRASLFLETQPSRTSSVSLSGCSSPETNHNSLQECCPGNAPLSYPCTAPTHSPVIVVGFSRLPLLHLHSLFRTPSLFLRASAKTPPLSKSASARLQPAFTRVEAPNRIPLRSTPPLSVSYRPHSFMTHTGDVGESTAPAAVGNDSIFEYKWDFGGHQPAHSQSLRLGNQGISGDSRLYFALSG